MIAASTPTRFVPFGRHHVKYIGTITSTNLYDTEELFTDTESNEKTNCKNVKEERWILRLIDDVEEELYVNGNSTVWSYGNCGENVPVDESEKHCERLIKQSYTVDNNIQQAFWYKFQENKSVLVPPGEVIDGVCIVMTNSLHIYGTNIEEYQTVFPFAVSKAWPSKFGLIFERMTSTSIRNIALSNYSIYLDNILPTIYALTHPHNELSPMFLWKNLVESSDDGVLSIAKDQSMKIVFTSEEPSICMMYDFRSRAHTVWKIRPATKQEIDTMKATQNASTQNVSESKTFSTLPDESSCSVYYPNNDTESNSWTTDPTGLPISSLLLNSKSKSIINRSDISVRRSNLYKTRLNATKLDRINFSCAEIQHGEIEGELCLEYLWSEDNEQKKKNTLMSISNKVFISTSFINQTFLCFIKPVIDQLVCTQIVIGNENSDRYITFGHTQCLPAIDAAYLPDAKITAVVDISNNIFLYTGVTLLGQVIFGGIYSNHHLASNSLFDAGPSPVNRSHCADRQRSLLSSTKIQQETSSAEDSFSLLMSKIAHNFSISETSSSSTPRIQTIRSVIGWSIILEYNDDSFHTVKFPVLVSSSFVEKFIELFRIILPEYIVLKMLVLWYVTRNAPGTQNISFEQEFKLFLEVLLRLLGYDINNFPLLKKWDRKNLQTPVNPKKKKESDVGTYEDWTYLLTTNYHQRHCPREVEYLLKKNTMSHAGAYEINLEAEFYPFFYIIFYALHLFYEDLKLNTDNQMLSILASLMYQLATDLNLDNYRYHYYSDFPRYISDIEKARASNSQILQKNVPIYLKREVPSIFKCAHCLLSKTVTNPLPYPHINLINDYSIIILQLISLYENEFVCFDEIIEEFNLPDQLNNLGTNSKLNLISQYGSLSKYHSNYDRILTLVVKSGLSDTDLILLPVGIGWYFANLIYICRYNPPRDLPDEQYLLIKREDLCRENDKFLYDMSAPSLTMENAIIKLIAHDKDDNDEHQVEEIDDGLSNLENEITDLLWKNDDRLQVVRSLLASSNPVTINTKSTADVNSPEFLEEQEKHLFNTLSRTLALPIGRGMLTLSTIHANTIEPMPIPKLCTKGKSSVTGATVDFTHIDVVPNIAIWASFHNGVAAGLCISPSSRDISDAWISLNKPKISETEVIPEHSGFLMALGLNGFLTKLRKIQMLEYLTRYPDLTSMGIIIGLSASLRGSEDLTLTKVLSLHLESLLPPTSMELDIEHKVQVASLLGIGLVYMGSANTQMINVLLSEIDRLPRPDTDNSYHRESHALTAGFGLGLVLLGRGSDMPTKSNEIISILRVYLTGGPRRSLKGFQTDSYGMINNLVEEEERINIDVTAPAAIAALGLIYFNTNNKTIGEWLKVPNTECGLENIRPDMLIERTIAYNFIFWDEIRPTKEWVESNVPADVIKHCLVKPNSETDLKKETLETINQAFCNIVCGACMSLGLRYAGSSNDDAISIIRHFCSLFLSLSKKSLAELIGKPTVEAAINVTLLSFAMVVAGTGNKEVLKLCTDLSNRVSQPTSGITYGSHMAVHMALGLVFLGNGRYSLSSSPEAVAAMFISFYPKFPIHSTDNRYHLQAFRHLYVLASEPRLMIPRDVDSGELVSVAMEFIVSDTAPDICRIEDKNAPLVLPELRFLKQVAVSDDNFLPIVFDSDENFDVLRNILKKSYLHVKRRVRLVPAFDDWQNCLTIRHDFQIKGTVFPWDTLAASIGAYTNIPDWVTQFKRCVLKDSIEPQTDVEEECSLFYLLKGAVAECTIDDKIHAIPFWLNMIMIIRELYNSPTAYCIWQIKLFIAIMDEAIHSRNDIKDDELAFYPKYANRAKTAKSKYHPVNKHLVLGTPKYCMNKENPYIVSLNQFVVSRERTYIVKELTENCMRHHKKQHNVNTQMDFKNILEDDIDPIIGSIKISYYTLFGLSSNSHICSNDNPFQAMARFNGKLSKKTTIVNMFTEDVANMEKVFNEFICAT